MAILVLAGLASVSTAMAQNGCMAFSVPAGPESGNFITGIWTAEGPAYLGHKAVNVKISVLDYGGLGVGKKSNTFKGTEVATYDFGDNNTFQTFITYVVEHFNDPSKSYLNAVENIVPGSGTGMFANATGTMTTHGAFGILNEQMDGWALFRTDGAICGIK